MKMTSKQVERKRHEMILRAIDRASPIGESGKKKLVIAIIENALQDLRSPLERTRTEALRFLKGGNAKWYLNTIGIDEEWFEDLLDAEPVCKLKAPVPHMDVSQEVRHGR